MMSWICAECGRECSPNDSGCPACRRQHAPPAAPNEGEDFVLPPAPEPEPFPVIGLESELSSQEEPFRAGVPADRSLTLHSPQSTALEPQIEIQVFPAEPRLRGAPSPPKLHAQTMPTARLFRPGARSKVQKRATAVLVAAVIFMAVGSSLQHYFSTPADSATVAVRSQAPRKLEAALVARLASSDTDAEYPFARFVEVTGLRVVDRDGHSQVHYVVVNHSSSQLGDIGLRIAVRSAALSDSAGPLFTLSARVPSLAPHESKEIRTDLDSNLPPSQLPDWVNLRTEVKVISPQ